MPQLLNTVLHPEYIALSFAIAFSGSYCGIHLSEQFRLCSKENKPKILGKKALMMMMSISIGGVAIWANHFVGMAAVGFIDPFENSIQLQYRYDKTMLSLIVVIALCYLGICVSSCDNFFTIDKREVIKSYVDGVRELNITEIKKLHTSLIYVVFKALTINITRILLGGVVTGAGICIMHYIGMSAVVIDADIEWNVGVVIASVLIAVIAASAAFFILFRLLAIYPNIELLRLTCAIIITIAVNGMHYTGMSAATYTYHEGKSADNYKPVGDVHTLATWVIIASIVILWIATHLVIADIRSWFYVSSESVRETDTLIKLLETEVAQSYIVETVISKYNTIRLGNNQRAKPASMLSKFRSRANGRSYSRSIKSKYLQMRSFMGLHSFGSKSNKCHIISVHECSPSVSTFSPDFSIESPMRHEIMTVSADSSLHILVNNRNSVCRNDTDNIVGGGGVGRIKTNQSQDIGRITAFLEFDSDRICSKNKTMTPCL